MKNLFFLWLTLCLAGPLCAQGEFFTPRSAKSLPDLNRTRLERTAKAHLSEITDLPALTKQLLAAPDQQKTPAAEGMLLALPSPDGTPVTFRIWRYEMIHPSVAALLPEVVNAYGEDAEGRGMRLSLSLTSSGINAMVRGGKNGRWMIDPVYAGDNRFVQSFYTKDSPATVARQCLVDEETRRFLQLPDLPARQAGTKLLSDCRLREYDIAIACTGEYFEYMVNTHGDGTNDGGPGDYTVVFERMMISLARVNQIFREDIALTFVLINQAESDTIQALFSDAATDPYDNSNTRQLLDINTVVLDAAIGDGMYDLGHVFSTSFGGLAGQGICFDDQEGAGATGLPSPETDAYDIDFVAHELGHQLGANHTFNNDSDGSCNGNRSNAAASEPGSGTTIMAYAGICSGDNVQSNSDPYFNIVSLEEIDASIGTDRFSNYTPAACATTSTGNLAPTVDAGSDYTIPANTPFILTATASDPDGGLLTYCWEQYFSSPSTAFAGEPTGSEPNVALFRSRVPTVSAERYFPAYTSVLNGITSGDYESLSTIARVMEFKCTVRDGVTNGGYGCPQTDDMTVTVVQTGSQFGVTLPNGGEALQLGASNTVTWEVAGTTANGIDCANVDILLSLDGGLTFPTTLATAVPNVGAADVTMPATSSSTARLLIRCSDNIFYDISDADFTLAPAGFAVTGETTAAVNCDEADVIDTYEVGVSSVGNFSGDVSLTTTGLPAAVTATFDQSPVNFAPGAAPTQNTIGLSLSGLSGLAAGNYEFQVIGSNGGTMETVDMMLTIPLSVTAPADGGQFLLEDNSGCSPTGGAFFYDNIDFEEYPGPQAVESYSLNLTANGSPRTIDDVETLPFFSGGCFADGTVIVYTVVANLADGTSVPTCERSFTLRKTLLPVNWLSFTARPQGKAARLDWRVEQDAFHAGFGLERSSTASAAWIRVAEIARQGTDGEASYGFTDRTVSAGETYYYRLRQEDVDGNFSYSETRSVTLVAQAVLAAFPNPTTGEVLLTTGLAGSTELTYTTFNAAGQRVGEGQLIDGRATLDLHQVPAGIYQIMVTDGAQYRKTVRVVRR